MYKVILTVILLCVPVAYGYAGPSIEFDETRYDAGRVGQDDKIEHVFGFRNTGDQPLTILRLVPS